MTQNAHGLLHILPHITCPFKNLLMFRNIGVKWFSFLRDFLVLKIVECHSYSFSKCLIIYLFNLQFNALFEKLRSKYFAPFSSTEDEFLIIRKILMTVWFFVHVLHVWWVLDMIMRIFWWRNVMNRCFGQVQEYGTFL